MKRIQRLFKSLRHALRGVQVVFNTEQSFRIQVLAGVLVLTLSALVGLRIYEWILVVLLIGSVLSLELINSIFERILDSFKPRIHPIVKDVKDIMAGAVLIASVAAAVIGIIIFYPHFIKLVGTLA